SEHSPEPPLRKNFILYANQEVQFDVDLKKGIHYFAVEKYIAKKIREIAQQRGVSAETLVNLWLKSKLSEAM
ncbi:MAG: hypothetical protein ACE5HO_18245, partial [bacterium]